jgi:hypothetical protein
MNDLGRLMFRIISLALALGLVTSRPVKAGPVVSYSTSGTFDVNSTTGSTIELNKGNFTIELFYTGTTETNLAFPESTAPFGTFTIDVVENGKAKLSTSGTFDLMLSQTDPTNSNGTFTSDISGSVQLGTSNDVTVTFNSQPNPITFGAITYTLPGSITLASSPAKGFCVHQHRSDSEHQRNNDDQRARTVVPAYRERRGRNGTGLCWLALPKEEGAYLTLRRNTSRRNGW